MVGGVVPAEGRSLANRRWRRQGHAPRRSRRRPDSGGVRAGIPARDGPDDSRVDARRHSDSCGPAGDSRDRRARCRSAASRPPTDGSRSGSTRAASRVRRSAHFRRLALLLSAAGLYALLAYQVTLRRREIGIRSALGADRRSIVRMILGKGVRLALAGAAVGVVGRGLVHPSAAEPAVRDRRPQRTELRGRRGSRAAGRGDRRVGARAPRGPRQPDDRTARRLRSHAGIASG